MFHWVVATWMRAAGFVCLFWVSFTNLWRSWPAKPPFPLKTQFEWQKRRRQRHRSSNGILSHFWGREPKLKAVSLAATWLVVVYSVGQARNLCYHAIPPCRSEVERPDILIHFSPGPTINYWDVLFFSVFVGLLSYLRFGPEKWPRAFCQSHSTEFSSKSLAWGQNDERSYQIASAPHNNCVSSTACQYLFSSKHLAWHNFNHFEWKYIRCTMFLLG